jgi:hypothetical protein
MSAVLNGVQRRAYKGSQKVFLAEQSIPPQPIEPGATLSESFVVKEVPATTVSRARPVVPILDIPLCILYGIGCLVADLVWAPDEQYKREVLPPGSAETQLYELLVPLRFENGETKVVSPSGDLQGNGDQQERFTDHTTRSPGISHGRCRWAMCQLGVRLGRREEALDGRMPRRAEGGTTASPAG